MSFRILILALLPTQQATVKEIFLGAGFESERISLKKTDNGKSGIIIYGWFNIIPFYKSPYESGVTVSPHGAGDPGGEGGLRLCLQK